MKNISSRRIFLTGSTGFLGCHVDSILNSRGITAKTSTARLHEMRSKDLKDIDTVIHCAGLIPDKSRIDSDFIHTNVAGTSRLIECCKLAGVKRFIFVSSMGVKFPSAYAKSKLEAEDLVKKSGLDWLILRPAHIYGPNHELDTLFRLLSKRIFCAMLGVGRYPLHIIYVKDCAKAIVDAALSDKIHDTFNIIANNIDEITYYRTVRDAMSANFILIPIPTFIARYRYGQNNIKVRTEGLLVPGIKDWPINNTPIHDAINEAYRALSITKTPDSVLNR
ncbi:MAG: NAD(P)-dependent oxidoreductase [Rhodospirillales bacterium]|nr:NAD(P)-dependent oxidoreductase [Rhodospirillales bacterium]